MIYRLSDLLTFQGKSKIKAEKGLHSGKYKFFTCSEKQEFFYNTCEHNQESIVFASGGKAIIHYCNEPFSASTDCLVYYSKNTDKFRLKYVYYYVKANLPFLERGFMGSGLEHIHNDYIMNLEIDLPSLETQDKIIKIFDKVFEIETLCQGLCDYLDLLVQSYFYKLFGNLVLNDKNWPIVKLSDISSFYNGLTYKDKDVSSDGVVVLRSSNVQNGELVLSDIVRVKCDIDRKFYVKNGDIIMCSRNGSENLIGKVALIDGINEEMSFGAFMMVIQTKHPSFLKTYFETDSFKKKIGVMASTTTINQITSDMLQGISLPFPSSNVLSTFDSIYDNIHKMKKTVMKISEQNDLMYKSLVQKYFRK